MANSIGRRARLFRLYSDRKMSVFFVAFIFVVIAVFFANWTFLRDSTKSYLNHMMLQRKWAAHLEEQEQSIQKLNGVPKTISQKEYTVQGPAAFTDLPTEVAELLKSVELKETKIEKILGPKNRPGFLIQKTSSRLNLNNLSITMPPMTGNDPWRKTFGTQTSQINSSVYQNRKWQVAYKSIRGVTENSIQITILATR